MTIYLISLYKKYHQQKDINTKLLIAKQIIDYQKKRPIELHFNNSSLLTLKGESWRPLNVNNFVGLFEISSFGRLKRLFRYVNGHYTGSPKRWEKKIMIPEIKSNGRLRHKLMVDGVFKRIHVHQSVAGAFLKNKNNELTINHIDGNPLNNYYLNLEYCSYSYNILHAIRVLGKKSIVKHLGDSPSSKGAVGQYSLDGKLIKKYSCRIEAVTDGFNAAHIGNVINGKRKSHAGFIWKALKK